MILREKLIKKIEKAFSRSPVVALLGPRQSGKTTLARRFVEADSENYFDLEDPLSLVRLEHPKTALEALTGIVIIDEVQRKPELFPILRVLADRKPVKARFLVLGSASPDLIKHSSESLAGRVETLHVTGFSLEEVGLKNLQKHWLRGGFPVAYLSRSETDSISWRKNFVQNILERDLPALGASFPSALLFRLWSMLAHYHGQIWNGSQIASSLGISEPTVRRYVDWLEGLFLLRQLKPWHANLGKRMVKSPKLYIRDSGILHYFLGINSNRNLLVHPQLGASWEGYIIEEILKNIPHEDSFFWATHNQAEIDLIILQKGELIGIECKRTDAPKITPSVRNAMKELDLKKVFIVYPGQKIFSLQKDVQALPVQKIDCIWK